MSRRATSGGGPARRWHRGAVVLAGCVLVVACGGGGEDDAAGGGGDRGPDSDPTVDPPGARVTLDGEDAAPVTSSGSAGDGPDTSTTPATTSSTPAATTSSTTPSATTIRAATTSTTAASTSTSTTPDPLPDPPPGAAGTCVAGLSVRERAALLVWPSVYSADWPGAVETVRSTGIGGVLLMRPEGWTRDDLAARLDELEAASRHGLIVATDEEGGDVQRLRFVQPLASQREVSTSRSPDEARQVIAGHGAVVRDVGVDMVLGPVVDVEPNAGEVPLRPSRFFVGPPATVAAYGAAYVEGWRDAGLLSVLKHYPGHGAASGDTHIEPGITPSFEDIAAWDLAPYRDLAALATDASVSVMIGHLTVPGLTDGVPATRSRAAVDHLRQDLGYGDALLITDALGMAAVGLPETDASVLAIEAGIDVVIFTLTSQTPAVIDAIESAVAAGRLSEDALTASAAKVMALLERDGHTCNSPA